MSKIKWLVLLSLSLVIPVVLAKVVRRHQEPSDSDRRYDINDYLTEVGL